MHSSKNGGDDAASGDAKGTSSATRQGWQVAKPVPFSFVVVVVCSFPWATKRLYFPFLPQTHFRSAVANVASTTLCSGALLTPTPKNSPFFPPIPPLPTVGGKNHCFCADCMCVPTSKSVDTQTLSNCQRVEIIRDGKRPSSQRKFGGERTMTPPPPSFSG